MGVVIDYFSPHGRTFMDCVAAQGVNGIARYLTNSPTDARQVTESEIADAHAAGLSVHFFYEMSPTYPAYFTYAQGAEDCRQAVYRLREIGAPDGTVVYFTVDVNVDPNIVVEYFNGIDSMTTPQIVPGGYGFESFCDFARARFPEVGKHLWQTYGTAHGPLDAWQHEQLAMCGVAVDLNECSVAGWRPKEKRVDSPEFLSQTAESIFYKVGDPPLVLEGIWRYPNGTTRTQVEKVYGLKPTNHVVYVMYPKVDQDSDETRDLNATPAIFVITVTSL